ncbi:hypothetical protein [Phycisphaera mikurensis]|uniref:Uncharacterized protein n=1 Tax=Phycisphaera mikurensis (strain NBRC 102666 / KCTC 22515 / FYK2301M01) TaxID=1142394 RepID=I0IDL9_PHYMF|nr:hypothetical protein [Phycisphaera mikurensis]MBB6441176.1 hypothetical protein [Phycisphaera mikurensis]BAM03357.1 hypothetical protein PSMK_11980 [Phycisphaera mikurensis NBRC 102666]
MPTTRLYDRRIANTLQAEPLTTLTLGGVAFRASRPHAFGLVIEAVVDPSPEQAEDYLHAVLLAEDRREAFFGLIEAEGLVVCRGIRREHPTYRPVAGKSTPGRLSQAEYYHHDGCSGPEKPRFDEIRLPWGSRPRRATTAVARFGDVVRAQLVALPERMVDDEVAGWRHAFAEHATRPPAEQWDTIQGRVTRRVRKELDAQRARAWFAEVDRLADAYLLPWEPGESRLMLNGHADLTRTMQHRRAEPAVREAGSATASLVKRWTAEEAGGFAGAVPAGGARGCRL